ncbi:hypothetical protein Tsubulata_039377 [Turnera subulata]|uniref:Hexosyltransferase n=1 Tax=Turnera subulata TaxID=218843 RepID=A0A9Q0F2X9_9ROSI|nr:hypothetical protein Tsubulata_039377 [Turnera subulata]
MEMHHHPSPLRTNINSKWFDLLAPNIHGGNIKIGLVNVDDNIREAYTHMPGLEAVNVDFRNVSRDLKWDDFFPEWIDEDEKWGPPSCPEMPMPRLEEYGGLNVIVAGVPCGARGTENKGIRDVFRLQVNLVVANLVVANGDQMVYVVFVGSCGPMQEIFRCEDLLTHVGDYWVYKPNLWKLKEKYSQSSPAVLELGHSSRHKRVAYATVLHSSEAYVCGAIALAQSILQSNSTHDLVLLHDSSLSPKSLRGLRDAGWKTRQIQPIRSPFAKKGSYNEWNYSKLRIWQLTDYDKVIFIDADLIVLKNIDKFFNYPQLSAAPNDQVIFNSGIMVIEPSTCMFEDLRSKRHKLASYNGGDQGYLNEVFTWWHRLPSRLNYLKIFERQKNKQHNIREDIYAIHFLGLKPWACYKDYDCNWDMVDRHIFASDSAHKKWWQVHDAMPKKLQQYCALTEKMDGRIKKWRGRAKDANLPNGHWKIKVRDPRQYHFVEGMYMSKNMASNKPSGSWQKLFLVFLTFISISLIIIALSLRPNFHLSDHKSLRLLNNPSTNNLSDSGLFDLSALKFGGGTSIKIGLVNLENHDIGRAYALMHGVEVVNVDFTQVSKKLKWEDFFPQWIDEDKKKGSPSCPEIPMPRMEDYGGLSVILARVPCGARNHTEKEGVRDVLRLQVNLVVANLVVANGDRVAYVVFMGSCGPMQEIFRCEDLEIIGCTSLTCGNSNKRCLCLLGNYSQSAPRLQDHNSHPKRVAYATVLHSSEVYVCGAIALAQSIRQTNSTHDLVLLHDSSLGAKSLQGLQAAGWKSRLIQRIRSPFSVNGSYNEWNYSKLRIWQLTDYDKVLFIDADLIVLKNVDKFFNYPQLSAAPNNRVIFNSGVMVIEPSTCMFKDLMSKRYKLVSYNAGDQGFLNEVFTWWHRLPWRLNYLKFFENPGKNKEHYIMDGLYTIHFLGWKPWMCYRDYDCNWDMVDRQIFASDSAHKKWWQVYDAMPKEMQQYCALTKDMDARLNKWRKRAKEVNLPDGHWKIKVKDPRQNHIVE